MLNAPAQIELIFPGWWTTLGLCGLLIDFIAALLLAASGTEWFINKTNRLVKKDFSEPAHAAYGELRTKGQLDENARKFDFLVSAFDPYIRGDVQSFRYEETETLLGDKVVVEFSSGHEEEYNQAIVQDAIERFETEFAESVRDRLSFAFGSLLVIGFSMQLVSFFVRNFIA